MNLKHILLNQVDLCEALIDNKIKTLFTCSNSYILNKIDEFQHIDTPCNYVPKPTTLYIKSLCFIDFLHRVNPKNKYKFIDSNILASIMNPKQYKYILMFLLYSKIILIKDETSNERVFFTSKKRNDHLVKHVHYYKLNDENIKFYFKSIKYIDQNNSRITKSFNQYINDVTSIELDDIVEYKRQNVIDMLSRPNCVLSGSPNEAERFVDFYHQALTQLKIQSPGKLSIDGKEKWKKFNNSDKSINTVDENNRTYTAITNMAKDDRKLLNYSFGFDVDNSHPFHLAMLLNEFYYNGGNINNIIEFYCGNNNTYGILNYSHFKGDYRMPEGVLQFIKDVQDDIDGDLRKRTKTASIDKNAKVSRAKDFWSDLTRDYRNLLIEKKNYMLKQTDKRKQKGLASTIEKLNMPFHELRSRVKVETFSQVFYNDKCIDYSKTPLGILFERRYPELLATIKKMKSQIYWYCKNHNMMKFDSKSKKLKTKYNLATVLMNLESTFMKANLMQLYNKFGGKFIEIHDAVYCVGNSDDLNVRNAKAYVKTIMLNTYKDFGVKPILGVESSKYKFHHKNFIINTNEESEVDKPKAKPVFSHSPNNNMDESSNWILDEAINNANNDSWRTPENLAWLHEFSIEQERLKKEREMNQPYLYDEPCYNNNEVTRMKIMTKKAIDENESWDAHIKQVNYNIAHFYDDESNWKLPEPINYYGLAI